MFYGFNFLWHSIKIHINGRLTNKAATEKQNEFQLQYRVYFRHLFKTDTIILSY